jgi:hypothetical protein
VVNPRICEVVKMATRMLFICSCGETFDIDNYAGMDAHLEANPDHTASEEYVHASVVASNPEEPS